MLSFFIGLGTLLLILLSVFVTLVVLMQRASANSGMGSALGGDAAESALGGAAGNVLTKTTTIGIAAFFLLSLLLFYANVAQNREAIIANEAASLSEAEALLEQDAAALSTVEEGELTMEEDTVFIEPDPTIEPTDLLEPEDAVEVLPVTPQSALEVEVTEPEAEPVDVQAVSE
jgi:protein translocase SecG subunit